ncbi:hypothetical protein GJV14_03520 [Enterobacteriaceae bacterium RIT697]|uniref:hypothetical protein n=1 Tax=Pantoea sp. YR343 TaxID=1144341 RepID=UPI000270E837|nr:hypothetical protein [Pantoea sp. YR343]KAJ9432434.1 hypothetical protein PMI39_008875 [Pantoea sp. YR343]MRT23013.1 hypothetical protein [Enterobacteriaceae bacterium RIT697]
MNKNWSLGQQQARANAHHARKVQRKTDAREGASHSPSQTTILFAYKGLVIRKHLNIYSVDKQIKISGVDPTLVDGQWNSGRTFAEAIDYMLESAKPERLEEVRNQYFNWRCGRCKVVCLYDNAYEDEVDSSYPRMHCKYCGFNTPLSEVEKASDEVMR